MQAGRSGQCLIDNFDPMLHWYLRGSAEVELAADVRCGDLLRFTRL